MNYKPESPTLIETGFKFFEVSPDGINGSFYAWALKATEHVKELQQPYEQEYDKRILPDILLRRVLYWYFEKSPSAFRFKNLDDKPPIPSFNASLPLEERDRIIIKCFNIMCETGELVKV